MREMYSPTSSSVPSAMITPGKPGLEKPPRRSSFPQAMMFLRFCRLLMWWNQMSARQRERLRTPSRAREAAAAAALSPEAATSAAISAAVAAAAAAAESTLSPPSELATASFTALWSAEFCSLDAPPADARILASFPTSHGYLERFANRHFSPLPPLAKRV